MSNEVKSIHSLTKTEQRAIVIKALNEAGFNDNQAATLMDISRQRVCAVQKKIKKGTLNPLVKKAKKAVEAIIQGKGIGDVKEIKASDVLNAAKMVLDRSDPVVQKTESSHVHLNVELKDEDRERYRRALGVTIEAEFEVVPERPKLCEPDSSSQLDSSCSPSASELPAEKSTNMEETDVISVLPLSSLEAQEISKILPISSPPESQSLRDGTFSV